MDRPKIFISSTIYDFKDLRSSLKFWLEEFGYQVQLSEFSDFEKDLDKNSYEACLKAIEKAQYFILLIGSRVGGYYDEKKKISITQKEYRKACQVAKRKGLKLIIFVRQELWDIRNDRKVLEKYLNDEYVKEKELTKNDLKKISLCPSSVVNDAEFIFNFMDEVCKKQEMKKALKKGTTFPEGNWVHRFSTFRDIVDVLKNEFPLSKRLPVLAYLFNIKMEVANNLRAFFSKEKNSIVFSGEWAKFAVNEMSGDLNSNSNIKGKYLRWLLIYYLFDRSGIELSTEFIDRALKSGEFLEYNVKSKGYESGDFHKVLFRLKKEIGFLKRIAIPGGSEKREFVNKYSQYNGEESVAVPNIELVTSSALYNVQYNILILSRYVLAYINNEKVIKFSDLELKPVHAFRGETERIKDEDVSVDEILSFLDRKIKKVTGVEKGQADEGK